MSSGIGGERVGRDELRSVQAPLKDRVRFDLDTDASEADLATLLRLTERYCVVLQTIAGTPKLDVEAAATR
jgi:uncharacterized OsmC-like protein